MLVWWMACATSSAPTIGDGCEAYLPGAVTEDDVEREVAAARARCASATSGGDPLRASGSCLTWKGLERAAECCDRVGGTLDGWAWREKDTVAPRCR